MIARCPDHPAVETERLSYGNGGRACPTCHNVICTRCGKPDQGAWMGGECGTCYGVTSRVRNVNKDRSAKHSAQSSVISWFEREAGALWPDLIERARTEFAIEYEEAPEPTMWTST